MPTEEGTLEQIALMAAEEVMDKIAGLGIKGSTCSAKAEVRVRAKIKLDNLRSYWANSQKINKVTEAVQAKYPQVTCWDFSDIEFTHKG